MSLIIVMVTLMKDSSSMEQDMARANIAIRMVVIITVNIEI